MMEVSTSHSRAEVVVRRTLCHKRTIVHGSWMPEDGHGCLIDYDESFDSR